jgi:hypothetical protein
MTSLLWRRVFVVTAMIAAAATAPPAASAVEVSAQTCFALLSDDQTKGGGLGLALEAGVPIIRLLRLPGSLVSVRVRTSALIGAGLAWSGELGGAIRLRLASRWAPEAAVWGLYLGGDLVRAIDNRGRLAKDPVAIQVGLNPLRFELDTGWVSFLAIRYGRTLFRSGRPPFAVSGTLVEIGRRW